MSLNSYSFFPRFPYFYGGGRRNRTFRAHNGTRVTAASASITVYTPIFNTLFIKRLVYYSFLSTLTTNTLTAVFFTHEKNLPTSWTLFFKQCSIFRAFPQPVTKSFVFFFHIYNISIIFGLSSNFLLTSQNTSFNFFKNIIS